MFQVSDWLIIEALNFQASIGPRSITPTTTYQVVIRCRLFHHSRSRHPSKKIHFVDGWLKLAPQWLTWRSFSPNNLRYLPPAMVPEAARRWSSCTAPTPLYPARQLKAIRHTSQGWHRSNHPGYQVLWISYPRIIISTLASRKPSLEVTRMGAHAPFPPHHICRGVI